MYRAALFVAAALTLSGCRAPLAPPPASLPVSESDFPNVLTQAPTSSPIGLSPMLHGEVKDWKAAKVQFISLEYPPVNFVSEIQTSGAYQVKLPAQPPAAFLKSLDRYIHGLAIYSPCSLDTLAISPSTAQVGEIKLFTARPGAFGPASIKPLYSPQPDFTVLNPFNGYSNATEKAIYLSEDASVKGELLCPNSYSDGGSSHLFVNMTFAKGWNAATVVYGPSQMAQKLLLRGGVTFNLPVP